MFKVNPQNTFLIIFRLWHFRTSSPLKMSSSIRKFCLFLEVLHIWAVVSHHFSMHYPPSWRNVKQQRLLQSRCAKHSHMLASSLPKYTPFPKTTLLSKLQSQPMWIPEFLHPVTSVIRWNNLHALKHWNHYRVFFCLFTFYKVYSHKHILKVGQTTGNEPCPKSEDCCVNKVVCTLSYSIGKSI